MSDSGRRGLSNIGGTLISAAVVGGLAYIGYTIYSCGKKTGSYSPSSLLSCGVGDVSGWTQEQGDKLQCQLGAGSAPQFPTSPLSWASKAAGAIYDSVSTGKNFAKSVQDQGMKIDCSRYS